MIDALLDPFRGAIGLRALLEVVVIGVACGPLGAWVLLFRQSYAAESVSHAMLPGLVIAALLGAPLLLGAAAGVLVAAGAIALAARDERIGPDAAVAVAITTLFGLGAALAVSPEVPPRIGELLFGDLLGVQTGDVLVTGVLAAGVAVALTAGHRSLTLAAFDPAGSRALGVRPGRVAAGLLGLLGITTVAAVGALGNLLVVALVLAPAAAALNIAPRLAVALPLAAVLTAGAGVAGLVVSFHLDLAAGASVALSALAIFALSLLRGRPAERARAGRLPIDALAVR